MSAERYIAGASAPPNASDRIAVDAAEKADAYFQQERKQDLLKVLSTAEGKRVLLRLLAESRLFLDPFDRDPVALAHGVGYQGLGRWLVRVLGEAGQELFPMLLLHQLEEDGRVAAMRQRLIDETRAR